MTDTINQVLSRLHQAVNEGDRNTVHNCYATNAKVVKSPLFSEQGKQHDCIDALTQFQRKYMPSHTVSEGDQIVIEAGDIALVISKLYLVPNATPDVLPCDQKRAVYVLSRQPNGEWQCVIDNFFGTDLLDFA